MKMCTDIELQAVKVLLQGTYIKNEEGNLLMHSYWSNDLGTKALCIEGFSNGLNLKDILDILINR